MNRNITIAALTSVCLSVLFAASAVYGAVTGTIGGFGAAYFLVQELASQPTTPDAGGGIFWGKDDGTPHYVNDAGADVGLLSTASGAPIDATYITQTANGSLSAEQAMGALATGLVKNTTTTGVQSIATPGTDYVSPGAVNNQTLNGCTIDGGTSAADTFRLRARNPTFSSWSNMLQITANNPPTMDFPTGASISGNAIYYATGANVATADGGTNADTAQGALTNLQTWNTVWKVADEALQNDNTVNNDAVLLFSATANKHYAFRLRIFFTATAAGDFKWALTWAQAPQLMNYSYHHIIPGTAAGTSALFSGVLTASGTNITMAGTGTTGGYVEIDGVCFANAGSTGNVNFQWSQATVDNNAGLKVLAGSSLEYRQVD